MKRIIFGDSGDTIPLGEVSTSDVIVARDCDGVIRGMVVQETPGYIVRTGGSTGATGHHETLKKCLESCPEGHLEWEFFIN